jgi:protein-disulfide isomerase
MEKLLFGHQDAQTESDLLSYAGKLKLDIQRFKADMGSEKAKAHVQRDRTEGERAGLRGTPFIVINGREFDTDVFRLDPDMDAWVALEIELIRGQNPEEKKPEVAEPQ